VLTVQGNDGVLSGELALGDAVSDIDLTFYRDEYVLVEHDKSQPPGSYRANFVRDADGRVAWLSYGGRMYGREE
jgi:hypothetical protein